MAWEPFTDHGRTLRALIVLGPRAGRDTRIVALEILNRSRAASPTARVDLRETAGSA